MLKFYRAFLFVVFLGWIYQNPISDLKDVIRITRYIYTAKNKNVTIASFDIKICPSYLDRRNVLAVCITLNTYRNRENFLSNQIENTFFSPVNLCACNMVNWRLWEWTHQKFYFINFLIIFIKFLSPYTLLV